ncbi:MAG TPA: pyridoxamine 5'-phosphate oxidase family protein [Acidimicrobiales bacterium]
MRALDLLGGAQIVSESDCWEMLATQSIGRVAFALEGQVEIFPVNYAIDGDAIIFRTNVGRKYTGAKVGEVAFEADSLDPVSKSGWSVVIHGSSRDATQLESAERPLGCQPWAGPKEFLVRITPRGISGRRVSPL